jgi:hypothetical protein
MPSWCPARPGEIPTDALFFARPRNGVFLVGPKRIVCAYGVGLQPMGRRYHRMVNRTQARTRDRIGDVVVTTGRVVNAVAPAACRAPLKRHKLLSHTTVIKQRQSMRVQ